MSFEIPWFAFLFYCFILNFHIHLDHTSLITAIAAALSRVDWIAAAMLCCKLNFIVHIYDLAITWESSSWMKISMNLFLFIPFTIFLFLFQNVSVSISKLQRKQLQGNVLLTSFFFSVAKKFLWQFWKKVIEIIFIASVPFFKETHDVLNFMDIRKEAAFHLTWHYWCA